MNRRKRRGQPLDGWVIVDKSYAVTSTQAMAIARRAFGANKAGHGGTLDPLATGVLPVAFGQATKTMSYIFDASKRYRFTVCWGVSRITGDAEGDIVSVHPHRPLESEICAILPRFTGEITQVPPQYSAIRVAGQRAYAMARRGENPELPPRRVKIESLCLIDCPDRDHAIFECVCGKGTYIRSLAYDMACALGTEGYIFALRRLAVGAFDLARSYRLEDLRECEPESADRAALLPIDAPLQFMPSLPVTDVQESYLRRGASIAYPGHDIVSSPARAIGPSGELVALVRWEGEKLLPMRVFATATE